MTPQSMGHPLSVGPGAQSAIDFGKVSLFSTSGIGNCDLGVDMSDCDLYHKMAPSFIHQSTRLSQARLNTGQTG